MQYTYDIMLIRPKSVDKLHGMRAIAPLGLLCLHSYLKKHGYNVLLKDMEREEITDNEWQMIRSGRIPVVGISMLSFIRSYPYRLMKQIRECSRDVKIVLGGVHASCMRDYIFKGDLPLDASVLGDGEEALLELLDHWLRGKGEFKDIRGIASPQHGVHKIRPLMDISNMTLLDYDEMEKYIIDWPLFSRYWPSYKVGDDVLSKLKYTTVNTSRGCIGRCSFCCWPHWRGEGRVRSAKNMYQELEHLVSRSFRAFSFNDDSFGMNKEVAIELCRMIIDNKMRIYWQTSMRADLVDDELLYYMKLAGCQVVSLGIESCSKKVLSAMKKGISKDQIYNSVRSIKNAGIKTFGLFMIGNVGENDDTINETIDFMKKLELDLYSAVGYVWVFPATRLEQYLIKNHGFSRDYWLQDTDGAPIVEDGFTKEDCAAWMQRILREVPWKWQPEGT